MASNPSPLIDWLRAFWQALAPASGEVEPRVSAPDEWRTEFHWRGPPLLFDRRRPEVFRRGRVLAKLDDIESVDVTRIRDDDSPDHWKVSFSLRRAWSVEIGRTRDDVEASIAAARLSTIAGVKVRAL